jgi:hypothetical protein
MKYAQKVDELQEGASMWWPESLSDKDAKVSVIPTLLRTQDDFIHILSISKVNPFQVIDVLVASKFPINLFVKHLCVLADYGGEPLQRLGRSFASIFPENNGKRALEFTWEGKAYSYEFKSLPIKGLGNKKLKTDGDGLCGEVTDLSGLYEDIIMILLHAAASQASSEAALSSCEIGSLLGKDEALQQYVKQRYILVSRITGGATANSLGQLAQKEVVDYLKNVLDDTYTIISNGSVVLRGYDKSSGMPFDVVVKKGTKIIGIEISFQVTTNSTIERKSGQAAGRMRLMNSNGHHIAYILDGAGNFQRRSAISTICDHSECTVAYSDSEFEKLCNWIKEVYA